MIEDTLSVKHPMASEQAAQWLLELEDPDVAEQRIAAWLVWMAEDSEHRRAFDRLQALQEHLNNLPRVPWPASREVASDEYDGTASVEQWNLWRRRDSVAPAPVSVSVSHPRRRYARIKLAGVAALSIVGLVVGVWFASDFLGHQSTTIATTVGELRRIQLSDGSRITVDGRSVVRVDMTSKSREVALDRGEAFFEVTKDPHRPFIVSAGDTAVRVLGTSFNVRRAGEDVTIAVADGEVEVRREHPPLPGSDDVRGQPPIASVSRISAGHELRFEAHHVATSIPVSSGTVAGWRAGRRQYIGEPLSAVIEDLGRYSTRRIIITDPAVGGLTVTGAVFEPDVERWLKSLEAAIPVRVSVGADGTVVIGAAVAQ
jgi:transmembrane sensor